MLEDCDSCFMVYYVVLTFFMLFCVCLILFVFYVSLLWVILLE